MLRVPLRNNFAKIPSAVHGRPCGRTHAQLWVVSDAWCMTVGSPWKGRKKGGRRIQCMSGTGRTVAMGWANFITGNCGSCSNHLLAHLLHTFFLVALSLVATLSMYAVQYNNQHPALYSNKCVYIYVHISLHASFFMHSIDQSIHCMEGPQGQFSRMCVTGRLSFHVSYLDNVNLSQLSLHMSVCLPCTQQSISLSTHSLKSGLNVRWICSSKRPHVMCIPYWFIDCKTHKMASCAWFVEETGVSFTYGETTVCNDSW